MARIKVTGWIDTEDILPGDLDLSHPMGLSGDYYESLVSGAQPLPPLDDLDFTLEPEVAEPTHQCSGAKKKGV